MTVKGRTTPRWGRDRSARWDPGPTNRVRSYPPRPTASLPEPEIQRADLPGRRGAAERSLHLTRDGDEVTLQLAGWFTDELTLNARHARFLRDTLTAWFPPAED